jgi:predicted GNAT family acetyltransferase
MTEHLEINRETKGKDGRYVVRLDGSEAYMTYREQEPGVLVFDHTLVPPKFRGTGIAAQLVKRGIDDAREEGNKIVPQCSYVAVQFRRHPEWNDLLAG